MLYQQELQEVNWQEKRLSHDEGIYLYGCSDVGNGGKGRSKQGESARVTGRKAVPFESAADGEIISSGRC